MYIDLFGPFRKASFAGNYYALVIVDDFSRYTWTFFIAYKNDAFDEFKKLAKVLQNENNCSFKSIRSGHGESSKLKYLIGSVKNMAFHIVFLLLEQHNDVVERKHRLENFARTILNESDLPIYFWVDGLSLMHIFWIEL